MVDLHPLLNLSQFKEMAGDKKVVSKVRSSELETGLSSSDDTVKAKRDTITSGPLSFGWKEIGPFHALREKCALDANTLFRFRDRFQFLEEVRIRFPQEGGKACHFSPGQVYFYEVAF